MTKTPQNIISPDFQLGILGGGQLGKMLCQAASSWELQTAILDKSKDFPAAPYATHFVEGDFNNYEDVMAFGKTVDVLTIEIEHVNTQALIDLKKMGKIVHPAPEKLNIIKDKGLQKQFYKNNNLPSSPFQLYPNKSSILKAIKAGKIRLPFVQKSREAGYDGKGVVVIKGQSDLKRLMDVPSVVEEKVDIKKELAVVVARNENGEMKAFEPVEMEFHPIANLVEFLVCPAQIHPAIRKSAIELAQKTMQAYGICGLLAVELFLDQEDNLLVNEVAPRPHNSGHHTIDSTSNSQFDQHLRGVLNLPLGEAKLHTPAVMVNLLGEDGFTGPTKYNNFESCLAIEGAHFHFYGKKITKPFRKMGHATVTDEDLKEAKKKGRSIMETLRIRS